VADRDGKVLPGLVARELSPDVQRQVWDLVKAEDPALAAFLTGDVVTRLRKEMGASPVFAAETVRRARGL
jgi:hypothetical protein